MVRVVINVVVLGQILDYLINLRVLVYFLESMRINELTKLMIKYDKIRQNVIKYDKIW